MTNKIKVVTKFIDLFDKLPAYLKAKCKDRKCNHRDRCVENGLGDYLLEFGFIVDIKGIKQYHIDYMCSDRWALFKSIKAGRNVLEMAKLMLEYVAKHKP